MDIFLSPIDSDTQFKLQSIKFRPDFKGLCGQFELFSSADGAKIAPNTKYVVQPFKLVLFTSSSHAEDNAIDFTHDPSTHDP